MRSTTLATLALLAAFGTAQAQTSSTGATTGTTTGATAGTTTHSTTGTQQRDSGKAADGAAPVVRTPNNAGPIAKGEGPAAIGRKGEDTKDRSNVKEQAKAAVRNDLVEKGPSVGKLPQPYHSDVNRAEVKQEAASAVRSGNVGKGPDVRR